MTTRRPRAAALLTLALAAALLAGCLPQGRGAPERAARPGPPVRLNEIQVLSSHNSYHVEPEPTLLEALRGAIGAEADGLQYTHRPLPEQLDAGVRHIELDVFVDDPEGGRYAEPRLVPALGLDPVDPALREPGLKVIHVQEVDYRSTCTTLARCLTQVRDWSDANPGHLPVTVQIEPKDDPIPDPGLGFVLPLPWTGDAFADLEAEIAAVFPPERVLTPSEVRGRHATLAEAVRAGDWPRLDRVRGQVMFVLDDSGAERDAYRAQIPDLADRTIFVDVPETDPDAAVMVINDPVGSGDRIRALVEEGFVVRTRADADTVQARTGDTTRREAALASGAQFVTTDYVWPDERFGTGYVVDLPGDDPARCNPVNAPRYCARADLRG